MVKKMLGILGDGQLAQMTCLAGQAMGFTMHVYASDRFNPAALVADQVWIGDLEDTERLMEFARSVDAVTYDTELLPIDGVRAAAQYTPAFPHPDVLYMAQNRIRERAFLLQHAIPTPRIGVVHTKEDIAASITQVGIPCVMKTAEQGYDGKGQVRIDDALQAPLAFVSLGSVPCVVEEWIEFEREMSVIVAGDQHGHVTTYAVIDNEHRHHILHLSKAPSTLPLEVQKEATDIARQIAKACSLVGLLTVEMFYAKDGRVLVNELEPRPHNSGHHTQVSAVTSQFAQLCRAMAGLELGSTEQQPAAMMNILGDMFLKTNEQPYTSPGFITPLVNDVTIFYYGKQQARADRKMGHILALANDVEAAAQKVRLQEKELVTKYGSGTGEHGATS